MERRHPGGALQPIYRKRSRQVAGSFCLLEDTRRGRCEWWLVSQGSPTHQGSRVVAGIPGFEDSPRVGITSATLRGLQKEPGARAAFDACSTGRSFGTLPEKSGRVRFAWYGPVDAGQLALDLSTSRPLDLSTSRPLDLSTSRPLDRAPAGSRCSIRTACVADSRLSIQFATTPDLPFRPATPRARPGTCDRYIVTERSKRAIRGSYVGRIA
jgi:hypothetical protein